MDKNIGFNRNIKLDWLNATASFCAEIDDPGEIRKKLDKVLSLDRTGSEAIRKSIDILINIWIKNRETYPTLVDFAIKNFHETFNSLDRIWLHYGLTLLYYSFFQEIVSIIGRLSKKGNLITNKEVIKQLAFERGYLGSLERSAQRIISSLRNWDILEDSDRLHKYKARRKEFSTENRNLQIWILQCAYISKKVEQIPFEDLIRLPELFPFNIDIKISEIRNKPQFKIFRLSGNMNIVELDSTDFL